MTLAPTATLKDELTTVLRGEVADDGYTRHLFSRDASMYTLMPTCVVFPVDAEDVAATVRIAAQHGVPVTARGAGTSLAGQTTSTGIVLDMSRHMSQILSVDGERRVARVQPGVVQDDLNRAAAPHGLKFGPDTSTSNRATIGGMIGNNSAGSGSVQLGMTIDHVRSLEVVLADGTIARLEPVDHATMLARSKEPGLLGQIYRELPQIVERNKQAAEENFPPFWRRACGYRLDRATGVTEGEGLDLAQFVVGSEGTLVIVTEAEVDLVPKASHTAFAVGHFESPQAAIAATPDALSLDPAQVELMDRTILDLSRSKIEFAGLSSVLQGDPEALLFVAFDGEDLDELGAKVARITEIWAQNGHGYATLNLVTPEQQRDLLKVRKSSLGLLMAASQGSNRPLAFVEDTAVPPERLADYTTRFKQVLDEEQMTAGFYGHASVGCLHIRPFVDLTDPEQIRAMRRVAIRIKDLVREFGGVNSSEHGDGLARSEFNREIFGDQLYEAMVEVKELFDPSGIMNPGKIVNAPAMTENLRDAALPPAPPLRTHLDFTVSGGMRAAADRCMNIGACRKSGVGVMCPSYMATRHEEDSTRGRANALVKALSEPDPAAGLSDDRLHEVLDLCLMCKACKSECPLGVDISKLKSEALAHRHEQHGVPLRSRVFGAIRSLNRLGSAMAPVANMMGKIPVGRTVMAKVVGIASARPLPTFHRVNLLRWNSARRARNAPTMGKVAYLADSFTTYTEPHIGAAAIRLLETSGWQVHLVSEGCCGRSALSKGLVDQAAQRAAELVGRLNSADLADAPVVGCEPSCLFTLRDETLTMLPGNPDVSPVASRVQQIEDLLGQAIDEGRLTLAQDSWLAGRRILYHGHCHQKAEVGTAATVALLRRIPGVTVEEVDAGCCGMAGSFGYESEHYDLSMQIGEDRLFPAVRAQDARTVICASGTSCREQIFHGTERSAWHPVELVLAATLPSSGERPADRQEDDERLRREAGS